MALFGSISEFVQSKESWAQYQERLQQFFVTNDVRNAKKNTGTLRPGSRPIASFQGATFYCHNIISEHHKALKQIAKNGLMFTESVCSLLMQNHAW